MYVWMCSFDRERTKWMLVMPATRLDHPHQHFYNDEWLVSILLFSWLCNTKGKTMKWIHIYIPQGFFFWFRWSSVILINTWHLWERDCYYLLSFEKLSMNKFNKWMPPFQLFIALFLTSTIWKRERSITIENRSNYILSARWTFRYSWRREKKKINSPPLSLSLSSIQI